MKKSILLTLTLAAATAIHAAVVVDYSGAGQVSSPSNLGGKGTGFDAGTAISPSSGYTGQTFYGAVATSNDTTAPLTNWSIQNDLTIGDFTKDWIQLYAPSTTTGVDKHHYGFLLFKQADFQEYSDLTGGVTLDSTTSLSYLMRRTAGSPTDVAFAIQTDSGYFLSTPTVLSTNQANGGESVTLADPTAASWKSFDPATSIASYGSDASPDLTNVLGIGLWFDNVRVGTSTSGMNINISDISFTAVPEPSTYALWGGFLALGLVLYRRRRVAA
jgi:hypothetical protein